MKKYIDGFIFPIAHNYLDEYMKVAEKVADIWKEHGAIEYFEFIEEKEHFPGTKAFSKVIEAGEDEEIIFGWVLFPSKEIRELAHKKVANDARMPKLIEPINNPERMVFNAERMVFGGFRLL